MELWSRIVSWLSPNVALAKIELYGPGTFDIEVVGESHYQETIKAVCGGRTEDGTNLEVTACLVCENDNPHDNQAIRVVIGHQTVGYLSRENARIYRKQLEKAGYEGHTANCQARIVGGWDRGGGDMGYFGVRLDLPTG